MNAKKIIYFLLLVVTLLSCDNDDGNAVNENVCNYAGLTAEILGTQTLIPEAQLQTDYFPNNDGAGQGAVEVFDTVNRGDTFVVTRATADGAIDTNPEIRINNIDYAGTVTCQRWNTGVGEELRFDIVLNSGDEAELCVVIDFVKP